MRSSKAHRRNGFFQAPMITQHLLTSFQDWQGWTNENWLKSRFHFNFAEYSEGPSSFGVLRVMNDDLVQAERGLKLTQRSAESLKLTLFVWKGWVCVVIRFCHIFWSLLDARMFHVLWQGFGEHPHRDMEIMTFIVDGYLTHKDVRLIWGFYHTLQGLERESRWKMSGLHGNRRDIGPWQLSIYDFRRENQIQTSLSTWYPLYSIVWVW